MASALGFIDGTVVAIALPAMRASLDASLFEAQWIHNAYMLSVAALILLGGAAGDRFGLARVFGVGIALFVLASLLCALAPTASVLIIARAVQGIGAAIMIPGSLAIIARAYPREERGRAIGIWAAASAMTTAMGPIIGGLALSLGGPEMWRWVFAVNLPLGALAVWLLWLKIGQDTARPDTPLDVPGALCVTLALLALAWGLTNSTPEQGGLNLPWIAIGVLGVCGFLWIETRTRHPMMPLSLFRSRTFAAANVMSFLLYCALALMFFFMPMTLITAWGVSEIETSAAFAPLSVFLSLLSTRAGRLADQIGPAPLLVTGALIVALGYGAIGWFAHEQNFWGRVMPAACLVGLGMALIVAPLSTAVISAVEEHQSGLASGINNAITRMSSLISVAAVGGFVAALYTNANGPASFGAISAAASHATAMTAAFQGVAYLSAILAILSALTALALSKRK